MSPTTTPLPKKGMSSGGVPACTRSVRVVWREMSVSICAGCAASMTFTPCNWQMRSTALKGSVAVSTWAVVVRTWAPSMRSESMVAVPSYLMKAVMRSSSPCVALRTAALFS